MRKNKREYQNLKKRLSGFELGWLVAILEGEGCFYFERSQAIAMMSTDFDVVDTYVKIVEKVIDKEVLIRCERMPANNKDRYCTKIHGENARKVLHVIISHMHSRRRQRIWQLLNGYKARKGTTLAAAGIDIATLVKSLEIKESV